MSIEYDIYLEHHKMNVKDGFNWLCVNMPEIFKNIYDDLDWQIGFAHDLSKTRDQEEYKAYDDYFYGRNKSYAVIQAFNYAWLSHIHHNKHHWQHWVLINDDSEEGINILDMPDNYIIEMICDWWAFSWNANDLYSIFQWYRDHKKYMKLSPATKQKVENILYKLKITLDIKEEKKQ